jgi:hypothetical protein
MPSRGLSVVDGQGAQIGKVADVHNFGAGDILEVSARGHRRAGSPPKLRFRVDSLQNDQIDGVAASLAGDDGGAGRAILPKARSVSGTRKMSPRGPRMPATGARASVLLPGNVSGGACCKLAGPRARCRDPVADLVRSVSPATGTARSTTRRPEAAPA